MTVALVQSGSVVSPSTQPTLPAGSGAANLLVLVLTYSTSPAPAVTTSGWVQAVTVTTNSASAEIWYLPGSANAGGVTGITLSNWSTTGNYGDGAQLLEFSGVTPVSPLDQTGTAAGVTDVSTSGNVADNDELAVSSTFLLNNAAASFTLTAGTGFTSSGNLANGTATLWALNTGDAYVCLYDYDLDTGASAGTIVTDALSNSNGTWISAQVIATFLPIVAAPPLTEPVSPGPAWHPGWGLPGLPGGIPFHVPPSSAPLTPEGTAGSAAGSGGASAVPSVAVTALLAGAGSAAATPSVGITILDESSAQILDEASAGILDEFGAGDAPAPLAGSGSAGSGVIIGVTAPLAGSGSAGSGVIIGVTALLAGSGSAVHVPAVDLIATLAGAGSAASGVIIGVTALLAGSGSASPAAAIGVTAALAGSGSAAPAAAAGVTALLAGTGSVTSGAVIGVTAVLAGTGSLTSAEFVPAVKVTALLAGAGSITAPQSAAVVLTARLAGAGRAFEQFYKIDISVYAGASKGDGWAAAVSAGDGKLAGASEGDGLSALASRGDGLVARPSVAQR